MNGIRIVRWCAAGLVAAIAFGTVNANAMQFRAVPIDSEGSIVIAAVGEIIPGDVARLDAFAGGLPSAVRIVGFALDSPGGNVMEAEKLADSIRRNRLPVIVAEGNQCVSACFLVFAAGVRKAVASDALIGVHSDSIAGRETEESMALTTALARDAAALGVPPDIVGKLVETTPGRVEWLTHDDLTEMEVAIFQPHTAPSPETNAPAATVAPPPSVPPSITTPATTAALTTTDEPPDFQEGLADRRNWEQWYAGLSGDYQRGAFFWSAHRSDPRPPSCYGTSGANLGDFTGGCLAAQRRLAGSDVRRKTDAVYRQGWNSY